MRLIHEAHYDFFFLSVLRGQLTPQVGEMFIFRATLTDNLSIPAGIVVDVNDTVSTSDQASLDQVVVFLEIRCVESATNLVVDEILPPNGQTEDVQTVVVDEVLHLTSTVLAIILM
jgi:hypothetical protein